MIPVGSARTAFVVAHLSEFCVSPSTNACETRDDARIARSRVGASVRPVPSELEIVMFLAADNSLT